MRKECRRRRIRESSSEDRLTWMRRPLRKISRHWMKHLGGKIRTFANLYTRSFRNINIRRHRNSALRMKDNMEQKSGAKGYLQTETDAIYCFRI